ncbi:CCA tRNA nucleotidyltransferase [Methanobrevibacter sp. TMH8]|uniref:CCA tRNA nucleotidyltransferase n=1 Tax=Methanobrevibacter sp. TMH8 TaxID=2848611 RepID=UPI001CCCF254|nr:CCA tRNA nucleotidyltransferase [Methanobrevibacter sp. TMH8]MBZ9571501.1 CCA tRNA nucleotidyltransferase [Methanobrevibacter sp. TMH8]
MNYKEILKEIKPTKEESEIVHKIATESITCIDNIAKRENINVETLLVGSIAKETWLSGSSDIDIFINFQLNTDVDYLKDKGLFLGYECSKQMKGIAEEHYASHPYLTSHINGYDVDFVPCYKIDCAEKLKSAVDRTVLHTKYIQKHLKEEQKDEVLLLKKFMKEVGTYGSEFKVGGFAGYLCEILILRYNTFEETLKAASNWKNKTIIDLKKYGTSKLFKDPLIAIDPTDKNRNVGAALRKEKMAEFIIASRNFLNSDEDKKIKYFKPLSKNIDCKNIIKQFKDRKTKTITITFDIPDVSVDSLHPQLKKTQQSIEEKLENNEFSVFKSDYWTDEESIAVLIFEMNVYKQNKYYIHEGPKIWDKKACDNFLAVHSDNSNNYDSHTEDYYVLEDMIVINKEREFRTAKAFIENILTKENIHIVKVGKNLKDLIISSYKLDNIKKLLKENKLNENSDFLNFLDDFLNPGQLLKRL